MADPNNTDHVCELRCLAAACAAHQLCTAQRITSTHNHRGRPTAPRAPPSPLRATTSSGRRPRRSRLAAAVHVRLSAVLGVVDVGRSCGRPPGTGRWRGASARRPGKGRGLGAGLEHCFGATLCRKLSSPQVFQNIGSNKWSIIARAYVPRQLSDWERANEGKGREGKGREGGPCAGLEH